MNAEDKARYEGLMRQADMCRLAAEEAIEEDSFVKAREAFDAHHAAVRAAMALNARPVETDPRCLSQDTRIPR